MWESICTVISSENTTSTNESNLSTFLAHFSLFSLFSSLIICQYFVLLEVHPRSLLHLSTVERETSRLSLCNNFCNSTPVVSLFSSICLLIRVFYTRSDFTGSTRARFTLNATCFSKMLQKLLKSKFVGLPLPRHPLFACCSFPSDGKKEFSV